MPKNQPSVEASNQRTEHPVSSLALAVRTTRHELADPINVTSSTETIDPIHQTLADVETDMIETMQEGDALMASNSIQQQDDEQMGEAWKKRTTDEVTKDESPDACRGPRKVQYAMHPDDDSD